MLKVVRQLTSDLYFAAVRYFRTRQVIKTVKVAHAVELSQTPGELWPLTIQKHKRDIAAIRAGQFDIVDRKSMAYPYLPEALHRLGQPILKSTPFNLRRFAETPIPRRAINLIKNAILKLPWKIVVNQDFEDNPERQKRVAAATRALKHPNNQDTWKTFIEPVIEDVIVGGYGTIEPAMTPFYKRPFKCWAVDGSTIRIYPDWSEAHPEKARYAQMVGLRSELGIQNFRDDELIYIRDNVRSNTPFGLGKLEVAFNSINAFLGVQDMASRAGADQVHKTWMWWKKPQATGHINTVIRHTQNEGEGQAKISFMSGMEPPEVIDVQAVTEGDLLPWWQEFLIRIIAQGFDLTPFALGLERDVNRNTSQTMTAQDFLSAVVPMATRVQEALSMGLLHKLMEWRDLEFQFIGLDDPDFTVKLQNFGLLDALDAITPDEVRLDTGRQPIPGGFGKLTKTQRQILITDALWKARSQDTAAMGGTGATQPGVQTQNPLNLPMKGAMFSAKDVAEMHPDKIKDMQKLQLLPPTKQLKDKMKEQEPNIFEQLSEELRDFFDTVTDEDKNAEIQPQKISKMDESQQLQDFRKREKQREEGSGLGFDRLTDSDIEPKAPKKVTNSVRKTKS